MAGRTVTGLMSETKSTFENLKKTADAAISGMERKKELEGQIQSLMAAVKSEESAIASLQAQYDKLEGELDKIPDDGDDDELNSNYEMVRQQVRERMQEVERELQEAERRKQAYERELENKKVERENVMRELMDQRGEIQGRTVRFLDRDNLPVEETLKIESRMVSRESDNPNLNRREEVLNISFRDRTLYSPPFGPCGLSEDETAMAVVLWQMGGYVRGICSNPYPLEEAAADILMGQALYL